MQEREPYERETEKAQIGDEMSYAFDASVFAGDSKQPDAVKKSGLVFIKTDAINGIPSFDQSLGFTPHSWVEGILVKHDHAYVRHPVLLAVRAEHREPDLPSRERR